MVVGSKLTKVTTSCYGDCSSVGRAPDCDSGGRGFEPHQSPQFVKTENLKLKLCCESGGIGRRAGFRFQCLAA